MAKLNIFISWSGPRSRAAAEALCTYLPHIANNLKPWMSAEILKGARWRSEISAKLAGATVGIICLTRSNLASSWLLFEAGAISKATENSYACTFLLDGLKSGEIPDPLGQFQHTEAREGEIFKLAKELNALLTEEDRMADSHLERAFKMWWPEIEKALKALPPDQDPKLPEREDRELLLESLDLARETNALLRNFARPSPRPTPGPFYGGGGAVDGAYTGDGPFVMTKLLGVQGGAAPGARSTGGTSGVQGAGPGARSTGPVTHVQGATGVGAGVRNNSSREVQGHHGPVSAERK